MKFNLIFTIIGVIGINAASPSHFSPPGLGGGGWDAYYCQQLSLGNISV